MKQMFKFFIGVFLTVAVTVISVAASIYACKNSDSRYYLLAIYAVIGLIGGYLVHNHLHEAGHAVGAKAFGATVFGMNVSGVIIEKGKKPRLDLKSGVAGWTSFVPKSPESSLRVLGNSLIGGFFGSFISLLIGVALYVAGLLTGIYPLIAVFGIYVSVNVYMISLNFFSDKAETDGVMFLNTSDLSPEFRDKLLMLEYQSHLLNGKSAKDIDFLINKRLIKGNVYTLFDVQKCLQTGDIIGAEAFIHSALYECENADNGHIDLLLEDLFVNILKDNKKNVQALTEKLDLYISEPNSPLSLRVAVFYRRYTKDDEWADSLEKTYFKTLDSYPLTGLAQTEREIYLRFAPNDKDFRL